MRDHILPEKVRERVRFNEDGLVPAVVQDTATGQVLMLAWMNEEALAATIATREGIYWSRSRNELWRKGATSGNVQTVLRLALDCDGDTVLLTVDQTGPACHTGDMTCFDSGEVEL